MNRREFLRRSLLIASGVIAADQLELLEKLSHKKVFQGADFAPPIVLDPKFGPLVTLSPLDRRTAERYRTGLAMGGSIYTYDDDDYYLVRTR